jgi:hypothetical protein
VGDLEAARRGALGLRVVERRATILLSELRLLCASRLDLGVEVAPRRVRDSTRRVVGLDGVLNERVDLELVAHVLEEVLLSPPLEHAVRDLGCLEVEPAREDRRLVPVVAEPSHLPEAERALEERDALGVQAVLDIASVEPCTVKAEQVPWDRLDSPLPVGEHVEVQIEELGEQLRAPTASIEDDHRPSPLPDDRADVGREGEEHLDHSCVRLGGDDEERIAMLVVDVVVRRRRGAEP